MRNILRTIVLLALTVSLCSGHVGDRVVPIFEISEESLSEIDIHDGEIGDWLTVMGEPSLTGRDLTADVSGTHGEEYDPSDLDFRIWLAWHRGLNRIYVAVEGVDDFLVDQGAENWYWDGLVGLEIDGDHSGGVFDRGSLETILLESQTFQGGPFSHQPFSNLNKPAVHLLYSIGLEECCWFSEPPFADVGTAIYGENPTVWMTEMYVTPFDRLVPDSRGDTVISELRPDGIIGLRVTVTDQDDGRKFAPDGVFFIPVFDSNFAQGPDQFADGLLVPVGGVASAVESVSWGRIKVSLEP